MIYGDFNQGFNVTGLGFLMAESPEFSDYLNTLSPEVQAGLEEHKDEIETIEDVKRIANEIELKR